MPKSSISLRTRIYMSMLILILISSVIIGIVTVTHFNSQNEEYHKDRLIRKERAVLAAVDYFLKAYSISTIPEDMAIILGDKFNEVADINKLNIHVYNVAGELLFSAKSDSIAVLDPDHQMDIFTLKMIEQDGKAVIKKDINNRSIISSYSLIYDNKNNSLVIINIPYLEKTDILREELTDFLIQLGEVYLFLLLGASLLAYFLSKYITGSLKTIGEKMRSTHINKKNEPLQWSGNDEIGRLIDAYNRMLGELENSAEKLAQSERETAWREMAKQVAHEIKNPLTPMKLSVQHLQRALKVSDESGEERLKKFCTTMIEQIDTLSNIASEFSNFAKMPKPVNEKIDLKEIIESVIDLYNKDSEIQFIHTIDCDDSCYVEGDKDQLVRVFNNLIKNAIQSIPSERRGVIELTLSDKNDQILIKISDNGCGISSDKLERIFSPNFTTKTSGMGLGLAMVKSIIENMNGKIWFETQETVGTTFFISLKKLNEHPF